MSNTYTYPTIAAWHRTSKPYYIEALVKLAQQTDAPRNATYAKRDITGKFTGWSTTDDVTDFDTRADMARLREIVEAEQL